MNKKAVKELQAHIEQQRKFDDKKALLEEIVYCLNQIPNIKVRSRWFKNTYEICSEINKYI